MAFDDYFTIKVWPDDDDGKVLYSVTVKDWDWPSDEWDSLTATLGKLEPGTDKRHCRTIGRMLKEGQNPERRTGDTAAMLLPSAAAIALG